MIWGHDQHFHQNFSEKKIGSFSFVKSFKDQLFYSRFFNCFCNKQFLLEDINWSLRLTICSYILTSPDG